MDLSHTFDANAGSGDGVADILRDTAEAWLARLQGLAPIAGMYCGMRGGRGMQTVLASGVFASLVDGTRAESIAAAFAADEEWEGAPDDWTKVCGGDAPMAGVGRILARPLSAQGEHMGLLAVAVSGSLPEGAREEWRRTCSVAATVAALHHEVESQRGRADALRALDVIAQSASRETDTQSLYALIHREVSRVMVCDAFYIGLFDGVDRVEYVYRCDQGECLPPKTEPLRGGPSTYCIRERRPFVLTPENANIHHAGSYLGQTRRSESAIHAPMLMDGEPIGVLSAQSYQRHVYQEEHVCLLGIIASRVAAAVRNAELLTHIRGQVESLKTLSRALQIRDKSLGLVDDLVLTSDPEGNITAYNEAVVRTLGYDAHELLGHPVLRLRSGGRGHWEAFRVARNRSITVVGKDGRKVPVLYSTEPLLENGEAVGYLTIAKDMSDVHRSVDAGREALNLERRRISRDLHDGLIQSLSIAKMQIQMLQQKGLDVKTRGELAALQETLSHGLVEARHYIVDLKNADLGPEGLVRGARRYAEELGRVAGFTVGVTSDTETSPLSDADEMQVFFILREALNNVRKHAQARHARISFRVSSDAFCMVVEDDGKGFDPAAAPAEGQAHWGLEHIRERAHDLGGHADISSAPGEGTRVRICIRLPRDSAEIPGGNAPTGERGER